MSQLEAALNWDRIAERVEDFVWERKEGDAIRRAEKKEDDDA
jgi:hypothetical protein